MSRLPRGISLWIVLLASTASFFAPSSASAQDAEARAPVPDSISPIEADPLTVHLLTAGPGAAVWERFGHNGIWIHDARTGEDVVWEWGVFDFAQEDFMVRLAKGTMLYSMQGQRLERMVNLYRAQGRDVWAQELAMTPDQEFELLARILNNAQPGNRDYLYHYYLDNCSTRVRDHLDAVLDGAIGDALRGDPTGVSFRDHTLRLLRPAPWAWAGIQYVLGRPGDREIDRWDEAFLPLKLRSGLEQVTVPDGAGGTRPLVVEDRTLVAPGEFEVTEARPTWWPIAAGIALALGGGVFLLLRGASVGNGGTGRVGSGGAGVRVGGALLLLWGLLIGGLGTLLFVAILFTDHDFWRWNENLFFSSPLTLGWIGVGIALLRRGEIGPRAAATVQLLATLAGAGLLVSVMPGGQETLSAAMVMASVPLGAFLALRTGGASGAGE